MSAMRPLIPLLTVLLPLVAACTEADEQSKPSTRDTSSAEALTRDGRYCAMISEDLAARSLGSSDLRATGQLLGSESGTGIYRCTIDVRGDQTNRLQVTVNLHDDSTVEGDDKAAPGCAALELPDRWPRGWSCWTLWKATGTGSLTSTARPTQDHTLTITHSTSPDQRAAAEQAASPLIRNLNDAVEALDPE